MGKLKALMLRKKIDEKKAELEALRSASNFEQREKDLEDAINEAKSDEEKEAVEAEVEKLEKDKAEASEKEKSLSDEVEGLEKELDEEEKKQEPAKEPTRKKVINMDTRQFYGMSMEQRDAFFNDETVKAFLGEVREHIQNKRALDNVGLTIPDVVLPLLKETTEKNSKLLPKVTKRDVAGTSRQTIMGTIPTAVWTEMCESLNELDLGFNDVEMDGYKVGGFFAVCNATLEDSDISLASQLIDALAISIAKALDKAIIYGTGSKMPLGIVTRLAQTAAPADYPKTARKWADLQSHIITGTGAVDNALFKEILNGSSCALNDYFDGGLTWVMNKKTHNALLVNAMGKNSNAAIVAGIGNQMPIFGGDIVELSFIPDNNIVFGYFPAYVLAQRAGTKIEQSRDYMFVEDQTVFKGTARYDGTPAIAEAFGVLTITTDEPTKSIDF